MREANQDDRAHAPATLRNREPILAVLREVLPAQGLVLEVASGTGEHATYLAGAVPRLTWQPSDTDPAHLRSIDAWRAEAGHENLRHAIWLDACDHPWPVPSADAVICVNMVHIAPWQAAEGLMHGAARVLRPGGVLYMYGPFKVDGAHTAPSNAAFDANLRHRDPSWGVRDVADVCTAAASVGFAHASTIEMPANNLSLVFRKER